ERGLEPIEKLAHRSRVRIEVRPGAAFTDRGKLDGYRLDPFLGKQGDHVRPHPCSREATGHQHDSRISCGHSLILTAAQRAARSSRAASARRCSTSSGGSCTSKSTSSIATRNASHRRSSSPVVYSHVCASIGSIVPQ